MKQRLIRTCLTGLGLSLALVSSTSAALDISPRPFARGQEQAGNLSTENTRPKARPIAAGLDPLAPLRPSLRPLSEQEHAARFIGPSLILASAAATHLPQSLVPSARSKSFEQKAMSRQKREERRSRREDRRNGRKGGGLCGDPAITGETVGNVPGRIGGCGVKNAVKVRSVSGVTLSTGAVMDCGTAKALRTWVDTGVKPAIGKRGGGVASLKVAAHYICRTRNNRKGAKISEHGKGRAIDISAVTLRDGSTITVLKGWRTKKDGAALKKMHKAACGPFGTVLGPNADRYHQDHFHFDTARYRSGSYCR